MEHLNGIIISRHCNCIHAICIHVWANSKCTGHKRRTFQNALVSILCCLAMFLELNKVPICGACCVRCNFARKWTSFNCISYFISCVPKTGTPKCQTTTPTAVANTSQQHTIFSEIKYTGLQFWNRSILSFHFQTFIRMQ